ncbi:MAG: TfuA-related McrA-glycine thioamidation protein [Candidatus Methanoperedens sp.]|nr:TfuA-related McrA-glycine thioamidation protein [Candidatus Methanoperedens sp.]
MKPVVYTGTSISHTQAKQILDADYRPPVRRGDLRRILNDTPEIIGIIDGVFLDSAAVAHREIIELLKIGVIVIGGASMGALRASELDTYGMIGVGRIYEMYRSGVIESDDEVAVTFNGETNESLSLPLVNIRETVNAAQTAGILHEEQAKAVLGITRKIFYPERNYRNIIAECEKKGIIKAAEKKILQDFFLENNVDLKRKDAILVLEKIKELSIEHEI